MTTDYPHKAKDRIGALIQALRTMVERDPEQDVMGIAVPVLDAVVTTVRPRS